jgi:hypothetical protein
MKTALTSLFLFVVMSFALFAESEFGNAKKTLPDISNPQSVADYLKSNLQNSKSDELKRLYALSDKRLVSSQTETRDGFDGEYGDWYIESKTEFTFNETGYLTEMYEYMRNDETGELDLFLKIEMGYNESGNMNSQTIYIFVKEMATFMEFMKGEIQYNDDGTMREMLLKQFDFMSMQWFDYEKTVYEYTDGKMTEENNFTVDEETGELYNDSYIEYFYDNSGYLETSNEYVLSESGEMIPSNEKFYTTNDAGKVIETKEYLWNPENEEWEASENVLFDYDNSGNPSEELFKWGDSFSNEFFEYSRIEYSYATENYDDYLLPVKMYFNPQYSEEIVNVPTGYIEYWNDGEDWYEEYKTTYEYANGLSSITENINTNFRLYPNPADEIIYFNSEEILINSHIDIFNLSGSKLISTELNNSSEINVSNLPAGLYLYNIQLEGRKYSGKIIIQ